MLECSNIKLDGDADVLIVCIDTETNEVVGQCKMLDNYSKIYHLYTKPGRRMHGVINEVICYCAYLSLKAGNLKIRGTCKKDLIPMYAKYGMVVVGGPDDEGWYDIEGVLPDLPQEGGQDE